MRVRRNLAVVSLLFFASGAAGLVYQVVWSRLLNEVFGVTAYAVTAVLATYLGGLALGGWALGRVADRHPDPLRLYGLLELGIGVSALLGTWVVRAFDPLDALAASRLAPDSAALLCLRVLLASAVILPPTFLMGGTLPAITRVFVDRIGQLGRRLSLLYALNTSGAVVGSVAAGFVLIRRLGVHPTLWLAVALNVAIGATSLLVARRAGPARAEAAPSPAPVEDGAGEPGSAWILVAMALSGFASLSLEVIWTRMLIVVVGTSTYAFVTMLSAFLVGIALGAFVARGFVDRIAHPRRVFGWIQLAIAASTLATLPLMRAILEGAQRWIDGAELRWVAAAAGRFGVSFLVMLVPTTLIGMTFPLASRSWARRVETLGGRLGQLYGANTLGNIAGAIVGGFVLLPALGMQRGIAVVTTLNLAAAAWALLPAREDHRRARFLLRAAPVSAGLWTCAALLVLWRPSPLPGTGGTAADPVRFYREGLVSTVKVVQRAADGRQLLMCVDGVTIGQSSAGVDKKQQVLAHLPFLLQTGRPPANVLTIGLGTGILAGELARHPGVARVEVVELSPTVIEGARLFSAYNGGVLDDPRVRVIADDGVSYLKRSTARYDAIVSDGKSRSGHAGNALFYSDDYYRIARAHLADGGLMVQWVPLDVPGEDLRTIVRTFVGAFPHAAAWLGQDSLFLVGAERALTLDLAHAQAVLDAPEAADLRRHGWRRAADVASLLVGDEAALRGWLSQDDAVNSLEHPVLEFYALVAAVQPGPQRVASNLAALAAVRRGGLPRVAISGGDPRALEASARAVDRLLDGAVALGRGDPAGIRLLEEAVAIAPEHGVVRQWAGEDILGAALDLDRRGDVDGALGLYPRALAAWPELTEAAVDLGRALAIRGRVPEAVAELQRAAALDPESGAAHRMLAKLLVGTGDVEGAIAHGREAVRIAPAVAETRDDLGLAYAMAGRSDEALAELREASRLEPEWAVPIGRIALLLATHPDPRARDPQEAVRLARRAADLADPRDTTELEILAAAYAAAGRFDEAQRTEQRTLELATAAGDAPLVAAARATLDLYRRGVALPGATR